MDRNARIAGDLDQDPFKWHVGGRLTWAPSKGAPGVGPHPPTRHHVYRLKAKTKEGAFKQGISDKARRRRAREAVQALFSRTVRSSRIRLQQGCGRGRTWQVLHPFRLHSETVRQHTRVAEADGLMELGRPSRGQLCHSVISISVVRRVAGLAHAGDLPSFRATPLAVNN
jgi:hypothetical protein